jgi:VCBS repeat-containing protein
LWNIESLQFSDSLHTLDAQTQPPSPPPPPGPTNAAPVIVSATATGSATEWADKSAAETANTPHTASGSVLYSDANALDTHSASFAARGSGYLGTFSLNTASIDSGDTVGWSFTVSDSAIDSMKAGQTKTQLYDVTIDDGHGGTIVQTITITLTGAGDAATRTRRARGNEADSTNESGLPGYEHGRHGDGADMDGDQIPAPHPAVHDIATLLGAHLQPGEYWV